MSEFQIFFKLVGLREVKKTLQAPVVWMLANRVQNIRPFVKVTLVFSLISTEHFLSMSAIMKIQSSLIPDFSTSPLYLKLRFQVSKVFFFVVKVKF